MVELPDSLHRARAAPGGAAPRAPRAAGRGRGRQGGRGAAETDAAGADGEQHPHARLEFKHDAYVDETPRARARGRAVFCVPRGFFMRSSERHARRPLVALCFFFSARRYAPSSVLYSFATGEWLRIENGPTYPSARHSHSLCVLQLTLDGVRDEAEAPSLFRCVLQLTLDDDDDADELGALRATAASGETTAL